MSNLRRVFTAGLMFVTVLAMSVTAVPQVDAAAEAGDLIKMEGLSSVYYLGSDGKRYVFPNADTYFSWYEDFSGVKTIPQSELESYPLGKNITIRPGTYLVKIQTDPKVYAVEPGGDLLHVADEEAAKALYGENWADRVVDVADAFFTNYNVTGEQVTSDSYPAGSLVKFDGSDIYYINDDGNARMIEDEAAFEANRFDWDDILTAPEGMDMPTEGDAVTGSESALFDPTSGAGGQAGAGTGLTVALASDTPEAGNVPQGASVKFTKLNLTASNDGAVSVNSVKLSAYELGDADNIDNVTFYQDGIKVGTSKNMTDDREAIFNFADPIEVPAGETESVTVKATISAGSGNYALGVEEASDITTNGAVVSGAFPVKGNVKSAVSGVTIGTVELQGMDGDTATAEIGEDDVLLAEFTLNTANEPILWESARFEQAGDTGVASNYRIEVEGDEVATAEEEGDYVSFDMDNYLIEKGDSADVEVYGDIGVAETSDEVNLQIEDVNDFNFTGQDYGFGIEMTHSNTDNSGIVVSLNADDVSLDMDKSEDGTPSAEVRGDTDNVELATMRLMSNGEDAEIESITGTDAATDFGILGAGLECGEIENVEMKDMDTGAIYDLNTTATSSTKHGCILSLDEEIYLTQSEERSFVFRADLKDSIEDGDELQVFVDNSAFTITGQSTDESLNLSPSTAKGAVITVQEASLSWTTSPMTDESFVTGATDKEIFKASVEAGDSSDIELRSVTLTASTSYAAFHDDNFAEVRAYLNGEELNSYSDDIASDGNSDASIQLDGFDSSSRIIPAGETYEFVVKADFASTFNPTGDFNLNIKQTADVEADDEDGDDVSSVGTLTVNEGVISRLVSLQDKGDLKVNLKTDDQDANDNFWLLAGTENSSEKYLGELVFTTQYEDVELEALDLTQNRDANNGDIAAVKLYDEEGEVVASESVDGSGNVEYDFSAGEVVLPADESTSMFVSVEAKTINADGDPEGTAEFGKTIQYNIDSVDAKGANSSEDITMGAGSGDLSFGQYSPAATTTNQATLTGAKLTSVVSEDLDDTLLSGGTSEIAKYKFVFDNGENRNPSNEEMLAQMQNLKLTIASSSGISVSGVNAYVEGNSSNNTDPAAFVAGNKVNINLATLEGDSELVDGEVTLVVEGDISGVGSDQYFQTKIADLPGGDFVYDGNHGSSGQITNPLLDVTKVTGDKLTN